MRVAQRRLIPPLLGEGRQRTKNVENAAAEYVEPAPHQHQVSVVGDESACSAKVDERLRRGGGVAESVNVRHHIVAESLLIGCDCAEIDVVQMPAHLADC